MIYRVRKQLVEEGFEAVLSRKQRATPAVARIFDGEKEAKLIALACSKPPKGRARWTLRLLLEQGRRTRHCRSWACPGFVDRRGLGIRVSGLTAFCPPLWGNLLVWPRASFRPGLHISDAVVSSGFQGRPARQRCGSPQCFQAAP
jgi:hypothetical protein